MAYHLGNYSTKKQVSKQLNQFRFYFHQKGVKTYKNQNPGKVDFYGILTIFTCKSYIVIPF